MINPNDSFKLYLFSPILYYQCIIVHFTLPCALVNNHLWFKFIGPYVRARHPNRNSYYLFNMYLVVLRLSGLLGQEKLRGSQSILSRGFFSPRFPRRSVSTFVGLCPVLNLRGHSHPSFHSAQPTQIPPFLFQLICEIVKWRLLQLIQVTWYHLCDPISE